MTVSTKMNRIQKTKGLGWPVEVKLKTGYKQGVYSDLSAMSKLKIKSKLNTENLLEKIVEKRNFFEAYKKVVANVNVNIRMSEKWKITMHKKWLKKLQNPLLKCYLNTES